MQWILVYLPEQIFLCQFASIGESGKGSGHVVLCITGMSRDYVSRDSVSTVDVLSLYDSSSVGLVSGCLMVSSIRR